MATGDGIERVLGELIVVSVIAERRRALGKVAEIRFVLLFKERVLRGKAVSDWFNVLGGGTTHYGG